MSFEDPNKKVPLFELNGFPILEHSVEEGDDFVTFNIDVKSDQPPTPDDFSFGDLLRKIEAVKTLTERGWTTIEGKSIVAMKQKRECTQKDSNVFTISITYSYSESQPTYH